MYDEDTLQVTIDPPLVDGGANITHYEYTGHFSTKLAQWKLDTIVEPTGTVKDSVNFYTGTASTNRPSINADGSMRFTLSQNNKVTVPWSAALNPDAFTVTVWAKAFSSTSTHASLLTSRSDSDGSSGFMIYNVGGQWQFWIKGDIPGWESLSASDGSVVLNTWQYIKISYRSGIMKLHVDGTVYTKVASSFSKNQDSNCGFQIGAGRCAGNGYFFDGNIKEVSFYNHYERINMINVTAANAIAPQPFTRNIDVKDVGQSLFELIDLEGLWNSFRGKVPWESRGSGR